jgi:hypothetical protein|tara:strand:- start:553 stop:942 length:390 start_codon:yes stop_codon:yes gene_type:complete
MKLWKIVLFALFVLASSCSIQPKPRLQITHVLAVTQEGDTLKLPIDVIRPVNYRIINYSSGYGYGWNNWYRPYYHNYIPSYSSGTSRSSNSASSSSGSSKNNYGQTPNPKSVPSIDRSSNSATIKEPRR